MIPSIQHVRDHAVQTPWVDEGDLLVAAVAVKMQVRRLADEVVFDIDTLSPAEDPETSYELHQSATIRLGRVHYLERKERLEELEREKVEAVDVAIGKIHLELQRIGHSIAPLQLGMWLAEPPVQDGPLDPEASWPPADPATTPPLP